MKILIISNLYPPNVVGGYERLCYQVANKLRERGHEIFVLTSDFGPPIPRELQNAKVERSLKLLCDTETIYKPFSGTDVERDQVNTHNLAELRRVTNTLRPDLCFCWNLYFLDISFQRELAELGVPTALFLTDNWLIGAETPDRMHQHFQRYVHGDEPFPTVFSAGDRWFPFMAIFGSAFVQALYHSCGYAFDKEIVVHNGVAAPSQDPDLAPDRSTLHKSGELRLLFAGRLVDIKGPQDCVGALKPIQSALGPSVRVSLTIVGDASDKAFKDELDNMITDSGAAEAITVLPPVSEGELIDMFNTHDMLVFPSLYEPFALTLILAMACGIPTIASGTGGNPEIVLHGKTGWLFHKGNVTELVQAVVELYNAPEKRRAIAERGRRFARRFSFNRMITNIEHVLQDRAAKPNSDDVSYTHPS